MTLTDFDVETSRTTTLKPTRFQSLEVEDAEAR